MQTVLALAAGIVAGVFMRRIILASKKLEGFFPPVLEAVGKR
jgi:hypothetical protein